MNHRGLICIAALCLIRGHAQAETIHAGTLSYDTFIPAGNGSPGVFAFNLSDLTGIYSLPTDFPITDRLTFGSAKLTLTLSNLSQQVITLGDIAPGFLLDGNGNPLVQVPGDEVFDSAEFTATLSPLSFQLFDGTQFTPDSGAIDITLLPSTGSTLIQDVDQTTIDLTQTLTPTAPEPSSLILSIIGLMALVRTKRKRHAKSGVKI